MHIPFFSPRSPAETMADAMKANVSELPGGPDTRTDAEVANQAKSMRPLNERNRAVNRRRKAIKAKRAAKKARKIQRRRR
jgi:hypothetical protein